jgi:large subunit ribosomal protein L31
MKKGIHPNYRPVVFQDAAANFAFLSQSCVQTNDTIQWTDGNEYPLYKLEISSASHPFFTGKMKLLDTTGRVQKFNDKYKKSGYGARRRTRPEGRRGEVARRARASCLGLP